MKVKGQRSKVKGRILLLLLAISVAACANGQMSQGGRGEGGQELFRIRGEVLWKGKMPVIYPIPTTAYDGACGKRRADSKLRLNRVRLWHNRLLDVAVWLEPVWEEMAPEDIANLKEGQRESYGEAIKIFEKGCEFDPRLITVPVGSRIEVYNKDRKDHWLVVEGKFRKREQYVQYYGASPEVFTFESPDVHNVQHDMPVELLADKKDMIHLMSGFHRWMDAWVVVTDKAWSDEVDKNGKFEFANIPKGVYKVYTWHPILGENMSVVKVPEDVRSMVAVDYVKEPEMIEDIPSTVITTPKEVKEEHSPPEIEAW